MSQTTSTDDARLGTLRAAGHTVQAIAAIENLSDTQVREALARHASTPEFVLAHTVADKTRAAAVADLERAVRTMHAAKTRERVATEAAQAAQKDVEDAARALANADHPVAVREQTNRAHPTNCDCGAQRVACAAVGIEPVHRVTPSGSAMGALAAGHRASAARQTADRSARTMPGARRAQINADPRPHPNSAQARRLSTTAAFARATT